MSAQITRNWKASATHVKKVADSQDRNDASIDLPVLKIGELRKNPRDSRLTPAGLTSTTFSPPRDPVCLPRRIAPMPRRTARHAPVGAWWLRAHLQSPRYARHWA